NNTGQFDSAFKVNYCTYGCNYAVNLYAEHIIDSIQDPTSPWLVADSLSNTSLQLKWDSANNDRITYLIQWKYQDIASLWTYYQMPKPLNETSIIISDLHPYMTYLFRVVWVVTVKHTFPSPASFPITTLPSGVPSQSPSVIELTSPSHSTIYVSWKELDFTNGPLIHYRVSIIDVLAEQHTQFIKDISPNLLTYTFTSLKSQTLYEIHLSAGNADGQGPITLINMTTMSPPNGK
ncbi:proto-oncogene tyrosine-protein kinase ROS-like, partial [Saccoglossus kowalevskii]